MGTHRADRIAKGGAVLNPDAVHCVGIVTAPDLRRVIQHARVKTPASAAAPLNQKVRIALRQALQEVIESQHIPVQDAARTVSSRRFVCRRIYVRYAAVHVPFQILDMGAVKDLAYTVKNVIRHLFPGKIQHQLTSAPDRLPSGHGKGPVRMFPVKTAVLRYHLRLHPDTEFHSQAVNPADQADQGTAQLFYVYLPVSQPGKIRIPVSEPSVVQHHHFHAQVLCLPCYVQYLFSGKIKVGGFPVVDQHRPGNGLVLSPAKAAAHGLMDAA